MALTRSKIKEGRESGGTGRPDLFLVILISGLLVFGLIMISSASVVMSKTGTGKENFYFFSQLQAAALGLFFLYVASRLDFNIWKKFSLVIFILNFAMLIAVFIPGLGFSHNGATRWINLGFMGYQPSESIKLALILFLAYWLEKKGDDIKDLYRGVLPFFAIVGSVIALVLMQPDMGTATVLAVTAGVMFFVSGASFRHLFAVLGVAVAGVAVLIKAAPYRMARLTIFLHPTSDKSGAGYQISQALLAIGTGGLTGLGFGRSRQKFNYLPEAATDSIFAVISEELGLIRASLVVFVFLLFGVRGYKIAKGAPDTFSRLVATGITTWIVAQAFINILAILSLMPLTGVPLPFISYGGTSLVMILTACGILLSISRHVDQGGINANSRLRWWNSWSYFTSSRSSRRASKTR
jgi:cell division protein FtsW